MNTIVQQYWNSSQPNTPGNCLAPCHEDAEVWINARVEYRHALGSEWGLVDYAKLDRLGRVWLHVLPDDGRLLARWRRLSDIMCVE